MRANLLGGRYVSAVTGSAPIAPELRAWVETLLEMHLLEGYGSTEAGAVFIDGRIARPPVLEYKLVDVPELGYRRTDVPHPRGELLVKSEQMFPGYYRRPDVTAQVFDEDGFYRTGDIVAELGPDLVAYVDRRNNVLKLSQGEFVTVSKLEAVFTTAPLVHQIYLYGNSARPYLLAVVVPTDPAATKQDIAAALQEAARTANLQSYELPRDFLIETTPFSLENGLLTGIRKLAWPKLKERYGAELEQLYTDLADGQAQELQALRAAGADRAGAGHRRPRRRRPAGRGQRRRRTRHTLHRSRRRFVVGVDIREPARRHLRCRGAGFGDREPGIGSAGHRRAHRDPARRRYRTADVRVDSRGGGHRGARRRSHPGQVPRPRDSCCRTVASEGRERDPHGAADRRDRLPRALPGAGMAGADESGGRQGDLPGPCPQRCRGPRPAGQDVRDRRPETGGALPRPRRRPPGGDRRGQGRGESRPGPGGLAAAGRHGGSHRGPGGTGQPRAALQRAVRAQRTGHRRADPDRADQQDQAVRVRVDHRGRRGDRSRPIRRGRRHPGHLGHQGRRRQLRQRVRHQQVGRRGAAARGARSGRAAGLGVPVRHDPGRHQLRRTAEPAGHVHPDDVQPGRRRHRAALVQSA